MNKRDMKQKIVEKKDSNEEMCEQSTRMLCLVPLVDTVGMIEFLHLLGLFFENIKPSLQFRNTVPYQSDRRGP